MEQSMVRSLGRPVVLVVEDDRAIGAALAELLSMEGYAVITAPTGFEALTVLDEVQPAVILLDWQMPVIDGGTFLRALRSEYDVRAPVLVLTAGRVSRAQALAAGADDFLPKPYHITDLLDRIQTLTGLSARAGPSPAPPG